jgi:hypothetical protein
MKSHLLGVAMVVLSVAILPSVVTAVDWRKPWSTEKAGALEGCRKTFDEFQLQAVCMQNEKKGYDEMQGNFGMPADVAQKAKDRCAKTFAEFQLQAVCMQNEKKGYDEMQGY